MIIFYFANAPQSFTTELKKAALINNKIASELKNPDKIPSRSSRRIYYAKTLEPILSLSNILDKSDIIITLTYGYTLDVVKKVNEHKFNCNLSHSCFFHEGSVLNRLINLIATYA